MTEELTWGHHVTRDGKRVSPFFADENAAFKWLMNHQPMSTDWAIKHEGYAFAFGVDRVRVLHGHTSPETAYLVDDYPYGRRLRCKIRYWVETAQKGAKKGQARFMSQTTNPKREGEFWNAPKGSTYCPTPVVMFLDNVDHVQWDGMGTWANPKLDARWRANGIYDQLTEAQRKEYDLCVRVAFKAYAQPWNEWTDLLGMLAGQLKRGEVPLFKNGAYEVPGGSPRYVGDADDIAVAMVHASKLALTE